MNRRVIDYADVVRAGRLRFSTDATLDLEVLADDLGVSRATLYRVIDGRDALLGDVLWTFGAEFLARAVESAEGAGIERVLDIQRRFWRELERSRNLRAFLDREVDAAVRVLFTPAGRVHERFVAATRRLLADAVEVGEWSPSLDLDDLAYVLVRVFESLWFSDVLAGRPPDLDTSLRVARAVLLAD